MRKLLIVVLLLGSLTAVADSRLDEALALLDADSLPADGDDAALARWDAGGKDLWVVAAIYGDSLIRAAVLREAGGEFALVARSDGEEPVTNEANLWVASLSLDLIPFRISAQDVAFGVRVQNSYFSTARSSSSEALHLYRLHGGKLTQVFAELTRASNYETPDEGDEEEGTETASAAVVIVSRKKHKGFHDLLLRDTETGATTRFRWNGTAYGAADATRSPPARN